jgi:hypothetical protein
MVEGVTTGAVVRVELQSPATRGGAWRPSPFHPGRAAPTASGLPDSGTKTQPSFAVACRNSQSLQKQARSNPLNEAVGVAFPVSCG